MTPVGIDVEDLADDFLAFTDKITDIFDPAGGDLGDMDESFLFSYSSRRTNATKSLTSSTVQTTSSPSSGHSLISCI